MKSLKSLIENYKKRANKFDELLTNKRNEVSKRQYYLWRGAEDGANIIVDILESHSTDKKPNFREIFDELSEILKEYPESDSGSWNDYYNTGIRAELHWGQTSLGEMAHDEDVTLFSGHRTRAPAKKRTPAVKVNIRKMF